MAATVTFRAMFLDSGTASPQGDLDIGKIDPHPPILHSHPCLPSRSSPWDQAERGISPAMEPLLGFFP